MSTVTNEQDAAPSTTAAPAAAQRFDPARLARLVLGGLAVLAALALLGGAVAATVGLETKRDATGYFVTHTHHYRTSSYALSTESLNVGGITGALEAGLLRLRITATSSHAAKRVFVGLARTEDVESYLAGVQHDELRDIDFTPFRIEYRRLGAGSPSAPPSTQRFWRARASGTGTRTISWPVEKGRWSAVVMNADGTRSVAVDARVGARLSGAWWLVTAGLVLGALALLGGIALIRSGASGR
jgi:hypothetical protein